jgi:hypothetical protein
MGELHCMPGNPRNCKRRMHNFKFLKMKKLELNEMETISGGMCALAVGMFCLASAFAIVTEGIGIGIALEAAGAAGECLIDKD